jgi:uncharacterized protein (DUF2141 family)
MIKFATFAAACLMTALTVTSAYAQDANSLTVAIDGVRSNNGNLMLGLKRLDPATGKLVDVGGQRVAATKGAMTVTFAGLAPGSYAVQMFHDENGDGIMSTNMFGIPTEGFAFSNAAKASFGPPSFDAMKVDVKGAARTTAVMAY